MAGLASMTSTHSQVHYDFVSAGIEKPKGKNGADEDSLLEALQV
jgi:hypothetical protein